MVKKVLRPVINRISRTFGIPLINSRLDQLDAQLRNSSRVDNSLVNHLENRIENYIFDNSAYLNQQVNDLKSLLNEAQQSVMNASKLHTESVTYEIRAHVDKNIQQFRRDLDGFRQIGRELENAQIPNSENPVQINQIDPSFYISFEDHFRGDANAIRAQQFEYLSLVTQLVSKDYPLLDLGCGRGEWLKILQENKVPSRGIDSNLSAVNECRSLGLEVFHGNLLNELSILPPQSLGAVTVFQVLEHLRFNDVMSVLRQCLRVLIPGGVFIAEIPNSETLRVGATTFWIDPTHERPLFPGVLTFLANSIGYSEVSGKYSCPLAPLPNLEGMPENGRQVLADLHQIIHGPGNFALIAIA